MLLRTPYVITRRVPNPISDNLVARNVYLNADALIDVSRDVSNRLSLQTSRNVKTILSCATQYRPYAGRVAAIRAQLGPGPVIGHVGALYDRHKGQAILLEAFKQLAGDYPDARLGLVGEGRDREAFRRLAKGEPRIHFAGFQADLILPVGNVRIVIRVLVRKVQARKGERNAHVQRSHLMPPA